MKQFDEDVFRDVTEQRRAEQELRSSEARQSAVLQRALDCIITMDQQGQVVEFNPAMRRTPPTMESPRSKPLRSFVPT